MLILRICVFSPGHEASSTSVFCFSDPQLPEPAAESHGFCDRAQEERDALSVCQWTAAEVRPK